MKTVFRILLSMFFVICFLSCSNVMLTGRKQLNLVSDQQILALGLQSHTEFMSSAQLSTNKQQTQKVKNVGNKLSEAVENYMRSAGLEKEIGNYKWQFDLVKADDVNAFCLPGGKIVF